jgi:peroxiredoxin
MKQIILFSCLLIAFFSTAAQEKPEGLFINSKAPDFKLKDQNGAEVSLKELRKKGPVVVLFYRGNWCPYCNKELKRFQDSLQFITDKGATLVAITPEAAEGVSKTIEKTGAAFPILYDADLKVSKGYAVTFDVDEKTAARYKNFGNDLMVINQQKGKVVLPVPAVYVVNRDGAVTYRFFDADYKKRPNVKDILAELK